MKCPRCSKTSSYPLNFYFEKKKVKLVARVCKVCGFLYAEDEDLLRAARTHLRILANRSCQDDNSKQ